MSSNKTFPTSESVDSFLESASDTRHAEAANLIVLMQGISGKEPHMWGPSLIGFGSKHYKYETGREGNMPDLAFSPRKACITIYFSEGFDRYAGELKSQTLVKSLVMGLSETFNSLTYSKRKEFARQVREAKAEDTRKRRIEKVISQL